MSREINEARDAKPKRPLRNTRPVIVSAHAVHQHQIRLRDRRPWDVIEQEIHDCVRVAIEEGHVSNHKPKAWRLYAEKGRQLPEGQRFVGDPEGRVGWIVASERETITVVTTITRTRA